jgi:tetraacyldisaccharide 4'-kinase
VAWLATELSALGRRPAVLSRGYGPRPPGADLSDEGLLLRRLLPPSVPYAEDPRRLRSAARLLAAHPEIDVFLLDDGFQHRRAARDLDIVLLDATEPFGFDHRLPRGLLREPPSALARADALVVTRAERASSGALAALRERLATYSDAPVAVARTAAVGLEVAGRTLSPEALRGRAVHACSGIGNPDAFAGLLGDLGARVVGRTDLPDHAMPSDAALAAVASRAAAEGAAWVVVTRKDAVKRARIPDGTAVLDVETRFLEGRDALLALVVAAIRPTG